MDLLISFPSGQDVPREAIADALRDALEGVGKPAEGGGTDIRFSLGSRTPRDKVLKMVRLTLELVAVPSARIVLDGVEYPFPDG